MALRGMFDASCPKCKKRFGWAGTILDKPACPRCGHIDKPSQKDIDELNKAEEELRQEMLKDHPSHTIVESYPDESRQDNGIEDAANRQPPSSPTRESSS